MERQKKRLVPWLLSFTMAAVVGALLANWIIPRQVSDWQLDHQAWPLLPGVIKWANQPSSSFWLFAVAVVLFLRLLVWFDRSAHRVFWELEFPAYAGAAWGALYRWFGPPLDTQASSERISFQDPAVLLMLSGFAMWLIIPLVRGAIKAAKMFILRQDLRWINREIPDVQGYDTGIVTRMFNGCTCGEDLNFPRLHVCRFFAFATPFYALDLAKRRSLISRLLVRGTYKKPEPKPIRKIPAPTKF